MGRRYSPLGAVLFDGNPSRSLVCAEILLRNGAQPNVPCRGRAGWDPNYYYPLAICSTFEMAALLLEWGADPSKASSRSWALENCELEAAIAAFGNKVSVLSACVWMSKQLRREWLDLGRIIAQILETEDLSGLLLSSV